MLLTGPVLLAEPVAAIVAPAADPLAEALPILQAKYVDFKALNYKPGDTLSDLVVRSGGKISLSAPETSSVPIPIVTALLPDNVIYWRLASFTPKKDWTDLAGELKTMVDVQHAVGAVLDLRSNTAPNDYAGAARVAILFAPAGLGLKYLPQKDVEGLPPLPMAGSQFDGPLVVLTNEHTTGAAEALAACLKTDGALVVGHATAGRAFVFEEDKLSSGQMLRFAVASPTLADAGHPVVPDIAVSEDDHTEKASLMLIRDNHISDVIEESAERHRLSEASLVQGQDPEWDAYLASLEKGPVLLSLPSVHDVVLISALDSLRAIRLSQSPVPSQAPQATANASPPVSSSIQ